MLNDETYRIWTQAFNPTGSYYEGKWEAGATMRFIGPDKDGVLSGILSTIKEVRPYDYVSVQHVGEIQEGKDKLWSSERLGSDGVFENYTFVDKEDGTEVHVDLDVEEEFEVMFQDMWPKALAILKKLAE
jgi:hypothetical protein